ncbi:Mitochondrial fission process protein 1 [Porphyridium purpureum]|uniref:Mitochondrial fission process protein 1 n=1 Tax=Porphyridium purpureum TaxID=35688 RepID=A0A5J4Z0X1_PORPP|nr:Mitochondrial fission process protein 1 [Porphyridium purpureum]|eukprot:POR7272..scf208_2
MGAAGFVLPSALGVVSGALCAPHARSSGWVPEGRRICARLQRSRVRQNRSRLVAVDSGSKGNDERTVDILRDTPARLIGYTNECGEAFRFFIGGPGVALSYGVAFSYVCADAVYQAMRRGGGEGAHAARVKSAIALDTLIWQTLASVVFPGFTINRVVYFSEHAMAAGNNALLDNHMHAVSASALHSACTLVGLCAIPVIVKPIDWFAHYLMDHAVRPWLLNPALHIHFDQDAIELDDK